MNLNVKRTKINKKRGRDWPIFLKKTLTSHYQNAIIFYIYIIVKIVRTENNAKEAVDRPFVKRLIRPELVQSNAGLQLRAGVVHLRLLAKLSLVIGLTFAEAAFASSLITKNLLQNFIDKLTRAQSYGQIFSENIRYADFKHSDWLKNLINQSELLEMRTAKI